MAKINVLYLITKATTGGAQKYVYDLATNLSKERFDVIVAYGERGRLAKDLAAAGVKLRELPSLARDIAIFSDIKSFVEMLKMFGELRPTVVHLNSSKAAALGALAARFCHIPKIIFTVHGWPFKERKNFLWRSIIFLASWLTAMLSHAVIVVSKKDEVLAKRMWGIGKKVHYVPLGIVPFSLLPPEDGYRAMFGTLSAAPFHAATIRLITIAELTKNKGLQYAIEAVANLRERGIDVVYVVVGDGEERGALQTLAKKLAVDDRTFFSGFIPNAARNLSGFDVFVLPSVKEGTPYVLLEAAYTGIQIVATDVVDEEFGKSTANTRLVPVGNSSLLADAIVELAGTPRTGALHSDLFPLWVMVQKTIALYH